MTKQPGETDIYMDASLTASHIAIAWISPDDQDIMDMLHLPLPNTTSLEAGLIANVHALDFIMYDYSHNIPTKIRILTDSYEALKGLQNPCSSLPLINQIIIQTTILYQYGTQVRVDWNPGYGATA